MANEEKLIHRLLHIIIRYYWNLLNTYVFLRISISGGQVVCSKSKIKEKISCNRGTIVFDKHLTTINFTRYDAGIIFFCAFIKSCFSTWKYVIFIKWNHAILNVCVCVSLYVYKCVCEAPKFPSLMNSIAAKIFPKQSSREKEHHV